MPLFGASRAIIVAVLAALIAVAPLPSWAQAYPSRPVQLVVGDAQGGTGDFIARVIVEKLTAALGQPVTVENRPGASGTSAAQSVARAAPVDRIFGVPGEENLDVLESLRTSRIELVLTRHEQARHSWQRPTDGSPAGPASVSRRSAPARSTLDRCGLRPSRRHADDHDHRSEADHDARQPASRSST